jgi:DNA-binding LacI/PurR family transcriptional regulator
VSENVGRHGLTNHLKKLLHLKKMMLLCNVNVHIWCPESFERAMGISIIDVAEKADVSRMTVTRVLRGEETVSDKTRVRVLRVMQELGYVPSPAARAMRSKDRLRGSGAQCFALIFGADTQLADGFFCDVARGAEQAASEHQLCPLQVHWQDTFNASWPRMQSVLSINGLCGAILVGQFMSEEVKAIQKHAERIVLVDGPAPTDVSAASVESDNLMGCHLAIQHLLKRGVRRLLVLTGPKEHYFSEAMMTAAEKFRRRFETVQIVKTDYTFTAAENVIAERYARGITYDGVFGNDEVCLGVLRKFADLTIRVPKEVRVIGFDDIPHASISYPRLSTVSIDKRQLGYESVITLVKLVRGDTKIEQMKKVIKARLIARETT